MSKQAKDLIFRLKEAATIVGCIECLEAADRIAELEAIVESLPKTADGAAVYPGLNVWLGDGTGPGEIEAIRTDPKIVAVNDFFKWPDHMVDHEGHSIRLLSSLFSTRAAAVTAAAKGETQK